MPDKKISLTEGLLGYGEVSKVDRLLGDKARCILERVKSTAKRRTYYVQVESAKLTLNVVVLELTETNDGLL